MPFCQYRTMESHRAREERRTFFLKVRLRSDEGWRDVTIGNVSSRGLMLRGVSLPPKGAFIEVRYRGICLIGRIAWSNGARCGVRTQDEVDIAALLSQSPVEPRKAQFDRRRVPRAHHKPPPGRMLASRIEASKRFAHIFDWSLVAAGGALAAATLAGAASSAMKQPMNEVHTALQQPKTDNHS